MKLILGDCLEKMKDIPDGSIDLVLTDPPYELGFMGNSWDKTGIANNVAMWRECLRVLKPGGHLLAFGGTRTYHRMASAIEDAGFEVRDMIEWIYGSGFPKSLNIGKAVDKLQGNEREILKIRTDGNKGGGVNTYDDDSYIWDKPFAETKGTSKWEGWGTALKPAHEPICMARKPLAEKTVAENVLKYGTGGINIDQSRVGTEKITINGGGGGEGTGWGKKEEINEERIGRFPANLIHDNSEEVRECFPETGKSKSGGKGKAIPRADNLAEETINERGGCDDNGGNASRFFKSIIYQAKASKSERNRGCEGLEEKEGIRTNAPRENKDVKTPTRANNHPTVKPTALMEYLLNMASRDGATILDPFMGSGTTGVACKKLNREFIGIELDETYYNIAKDRINNTPSPLPLCPSSKNI